MKHFFSLLFLLCGTLCVSAQQIRVAYEEEKLNEVLLDLSTRYFVQISIDSEVSGLCEINMDANFPSIDQAMQAIAKECNLEISKIKNVFTFRAKNIPPKKTSEYLYQGIVKEYESEEPLPFTFMQAEDISFYTDENGRFSFKSSKPQASFQIKHLGYEILDSIVPAGNGLEIVLSPQTIALDEVLLSNKNPVYHASVGNEAGRIKLNNVSSQAVLGNSNNIIFDHLRLYPGVMAAGESVSDYIFWGSYAGQTEVIYDGITLFSNWGIYNDIGRVNPLMIKNIEVFKGGYNADVGDRVGGVLLIDSKLGTQSKAEGILAVNSQTSNAYLSIPLADEGNTTLQLSGRQSYFNFSKKDASENNVIPDYNYGDFNFKLSTRFKNSDRLEWSSILSNDSYLESFENRRSVASYKKESSSSQIGNALKYFKTWKNGGISTFTLSQSSYTTNLDVSIDFKEGVQDNYQDLEGKVVWDNTIGESSAKWKHSFPLKKKQQFELGASWIQNTFALNSTNYLKDSYPSTPLNRLSFYLKNRMQLFENFDVTPGLKMDAPLTYEQLFFQPRINGNFQFSEKWNIHFGWGLYNQFIGKVPVINDIKDRVDLWFPLDDGNLNILHAKHHVLGISQQSETFEMTVEGFYKKTEGLGRIFNRRRNVTYDNRKTRTYGVDVYAKKRLQNHEFWLAYSWGNVQETLLEGQAYDFYVDAQHSQLHEIKGVAIFDFDPFRFSITQVYGTGFPESQRLEPNVLINDTSPDVSYSRTDISLQYDFKFRTLDLEAGFSVLNLFDRKNIRLNQATNFPDNFTVTPTGIPFNPVVYLNIRF